MSDELLNIDRNRKSTDPKDMGAGRRGLWISATLLSIVAIILGIFVIASGYLKNPAPIQILPDWNPTQFNILLGILLIVMGVFLVLVVGPASRARQKNENLKKNLEYEISRSRKIEKDFDRAQEISKTGNWVLELLDQKMWWSNEICRILNYSPEKSGMSFKVFLEFIHPDERDFVENEIQKSIRLGTAFNLTHRIIRQDGSIRMVKQRSEIYLDQTGKPIQILGTLQDITDQKDAENQADRLSRIVDKSFNEIYIFDAETLRYTKVNLAARLNLRYNMEELCEMTPMDMLPEFTPEKFNKLIASLNRGVESYTAFETVHKKKNGTLYPVDIRLQLSRNATRPQFVAIVQDITDRRKVESMFSKTLEDIDKEIYERTVNLTKLNKDLQTKANKNQMAIEILEASEHRLIEIINNVVDGIITIDEEGTIHSFNRAAEQLFGHKIEEVLGQNIDILILGTGGSRSEEYFENPFQSKMSAALGARRVIEARKKDGATFSVELSVSETVIEGQRLFTGLIRNLEVKEQVEYELMQILKPTTKP